MEITFKKNIVVLLSGLTVFCVILLMPLPEGMNESAQRMFAIVLLMAIWWVGEGTSIAVTALLPLILFPLLGIMPSKEVASNYANHLIFLFQDLPCISPSEKRKHTSNLLVPIHLDI